MIPKKRPIILSLVILGAGLASCAKAQTGNTCGDGIRQLYEECEGTNLAGQSCSSLGLGTGSLACSADCTFDTSGCSSAARCGDNIQQPGEQCDGQDLGGASCTSLNLGGGTLSCSAQCQFDSSGCSNQAQCGNGVVEGGEECDGANLGGKQCQTLGQGFSGGTLSCKSDCSLDTSQCTTTTACGNNIIESGEQCDGSQFAGATCQTFGYAGGQLRCTSTCTIDQSGCSSQAENCTNDIDDDGDGAIDCNDLDCASNQACNGSPENCTNGVDDDHDDLTDCDDADCSGQSACQGADEEICDNGTDGNGLCDCQDILSCFLDMACFLVDTTETNCTDGIDDDLDCLVDCDDDDCASEVACGATPENCSNSIDDDGDGLTDCADSDCSQDAACNQPENCSNGSDDDHDGLTDCDDHDCDGDPNCATCRIAGTIDCGGQVTGDNADGRAHLAGDEYGCTDYSETGPELVYSLTAAQDTTAHITLHATNGNDLDLVVTDSSGQDCDPTSCELSAQTAGSDETLDKTVTSGSTYYIIVDGYDGATDSFTLSVTCD